MMKHSKDRLSPRECAAGLLIVSGLALFTCVDADKPLQLVVTLTIAVALLAIGAAILNWAEIKEYMKSEDTYGQEKIGRNS